MEDGVFNEQVISTWTETTTTPFNDSQLSISPEYPYNLHMESPDQQGSITITGDVVAAFRLYLGQILNGTVSFNSAGETLEVDIGIPPISSEDQVGAANPNVIQAIFQAMNDTSVISDGENPTNPLHSLDALLHRVANSITAAIRNNGTGTGPAVGSTWQNTVTIHVRWI